MSSPSSPYKKFMASALASGVVEDEPLVAQKENQKPSPASVRHQLVENVAGSVFVFGATPDEALSQILAAKSITRKSSKRPPQPRD